MERLNDSSKSMIQQLKEFGLLDEERLPIKDSLSLYNYLKTVECKLNQDLSKFNTKRDLKEHMEEIHNYNVIKDATQSLLGSLSSQTGQSVTELHEQFGVKDSFTRQILEELRICFLENNYSGAAKLLEWVLQRSTKPDLPILWRSAVVLFLHEECSNQDLLHEFLEMCADQRIPEDKQKLVKLLISLPDDPKMLAPRTKRLSRKETSEGTDSRSVTENEDPDDPDFIF